MKGEIEENQHISSVLGFRILIALIIYAIFFGVLFSFLWILQVKKGNDLAEFAQNRVIRYIRKIPVRGCIYSSDLKKIADNQVCYNLIFHVGEMRKGPRRKTVDYIIKEAYEMGVKLRRPLPFFDRDQVVVDLNPAVSFEIFKQKNNEIYQSLGSLIEFHLYHHPVMPLVVYYDLSVEELSFVEELANKNPGIAIEAVYKRVYPLNIAAQVIGFTANSRLSNQKELKRYAYTTPELIGRDGLEIFYNKELTGQAGSQTVIVDSLGYYEERHAEPIEPIHGNDLFLTINADMQDFVEKQFLGKKGSCVIVDIHTGAVKAMVSSPTYSPTIMNATYYKKLLQDPNQPLQNRSVGSFSPGSIIKPLGIMQALELGAITADTANYCDGYSPIGKTRIRCSNRYGHGELNAEEALACSCNDYMIDLVLKYGMEMEDFQQIYSAAGIGKRPNIDLPYASAGLVPSREWVQKNENRKWTIFDSALITLGQGKVTLSPLHAALYTAAIANGGKIYQPYLVQKICDPQGVVITEHNPLISNILPISQENINIVKEGMIAAVATSIGTARSIRNNLVEIAGKTGSAQRGSGTTKKVDSWFIGFAPCENPQYAICVLVQDGVGGGTDAAPIAGAFFKKYLKNE